MAKLPPLSKDVRAFVQSINAAVKRPDGPNTIADLWAKVSRMGRGDQARLHLSRKARSIVDRL